MAAVVRDIRGTSVLNATLSYLLKLLHAYLISLRTENIFKIYVIIRGAYINLVHSKYFLFIMSTINPNIHA